LDGAEAHASLCELPDGLDEMREGAAKPVQAPNDQGVAGSQMGERVGEPKASYWRARVWSRVETRA
jgi:hypothetical protein